MSRNNERILKKAQRQVAQRKDRVKNAEILRKEKKN
jgi:hypothetical protein